MASTPEGPRYDIHSLLKDAVDRGDWEIVGRHIKRGVDAVSHESATFEACKRASKKQLKRHILPHCKRTQLVSVVNRLLSEGLSREAARTLDCVDHDWRSYPDKLSLLHLIVKGNWEDLNMVLDLCIHDSDEVCKVLQMREVKETIQRERKVEVLFEPGKGPLEMNETQGMKKMFPLIVDFHKEKRERVIHICIGPVCAGDQINVVIDKMINVTDKEKSKSGYLPHDENVFQAKCIIYRFDEVTSQCVSFSKYECEEPKLDFQIQQIFTRNVWSEVEKLLQDNLTDTIKNDILKIAFEKADYLVLTDIIAPHCTSGQLDNLLQVIIYQKNWLYVSKLLKLHDWKKEWKIDENLLDSNMLNMIAQGHWSDIVNTLQQGVSKSQLVWILKVATQRAPDLDVIKQILLIFEVQRGALATEEETLYRVLLELVAEQRWQDIDAKLKSGVSESHATVVIIASCMQLDSNVNLRAAEEQEDFKDYVMSHCADAQLEFVLNVAVKQKMWRIVDNVLHRGLMNEKHSWAIHKACEFAAGEDLDLILEHCTYKEFDSLKKEAKEKSWWSTVAEMILIEGIFVSDKDLLSNLPEQLRDYMVTDMVRRRTSLDDLDEVLKRGVCDETRRLAIQEACKRAENKVTGETYKKATAPPQVQEITCEKIIRKSVYKFLPTEEKSLIKHILPHYIYNQMELVMTIFKERGLWKAAYALLFKFVDDTLYRWAISENNARDNDLAFWNFAFNPFHGKNVLSKLYKRSRRIMHKRRMRVKNNPYIQDKQELCMSGRLEKDGRAFPALFCSVLCESVTAVLLEKWLHKEEETEGLKVENMTLSRRAVLAIYEVMSQKARLQGNTSVHCTLYHQFCETTHFGDRRNPVFVFYFIKFLVGKCHSDKQWRAHTQDFLYILATIPVVPDIQNAALKILLLNGRWDIISHARLSHVCEQIRRELFQAAVKQRQWSAVKRWADHTLYDDQRYWAMDEAKKDCQWEVCLLLADYGFLESERTIVHGLLAKNANFSLVLRMLEGGVSINELEYFVLRAEMKNRKNAKTQEKMHIDSTTEHLRERGKLLERLKQTFNEKIKTRSDIKKALEQCDWSVLLHWITKSIPDTKKILKKALAAEAWDVVIHLLKLGIKPGKREMLFQKMIKKQQWGVCRILLELGVRFEVYKKQLPAMMDANQWILLSRMVEYNTDKATVRNIMLHALHRKEGSVFWRCYSSLQSTFSTEEREEWFQNALNLDIWQAVKPLIEEKDVTGIRHRDTALLEAIEQHQWDVVDHCQRHHADINMKDDDGHTPIHRAARKKDWEAVKELTVRDGDPNLLDSKGLSVLHLAVRATQWDVVKLLIQYHGNIHHFSKEGNMGKISRSPLQMLTDAGATDVIESSLMWSPDQGKQRTKEGKTVLHAACLSDKPDLLYYLIARKADPKALTRRGHSALSFATMNNNRSQEMLLECIKRGFCIFQPAITDNAKKNKPWVSPLVLAVMRGLPVAVKMLYESGSCSNKELFQLCPIMRKMTHPTSELGCKLHKRFKDEIPFISYLITLDPNTTGNYIYKYPFEKPNIELIRTSARFVLKASKTPRKLKSLCRQHIISCLKVNKRFQLSVEKLPRLTDKMKQYLLFSGPAFLLFDRDQENCNNEAREDEGEPGDDEILGTAIKDEDDDKYMNYYLPLELEKNPWFLYDLIAQKLSKRLLYRDGDHFRNCEDTLTMHTDAEGDVEVFFVPR